MLGPRPSRIAVRYYANEGVWRRIASVCVPPRAAGSGTLFRVNESKTLRYSRNPKSAFPPVYRSRDCPARLGLFVP